MIRKFKTWLLLIVFCISVFGFAPKTSQAANTTLTLSPSSTSVTINNNFTVDINLDTGGGPIDAVDVYSLHFNPAVLQVVDSNAGTAGVQIAPGTILPNNVVNTVDNTAGILQYSQASSGGGSFTGTGTLATITFKGVGVGSSSVTMDFIPGNTDDTNAAFQGLEQLTSVGNGSFTVNAAPTFDFSMANGGNKSVVQGQNVTNSITSTLSTGSTSNVTFTASGLPTGVTAAFSPTSCSPTCSSTLTLTASGSATVGTSTVTVTGTSSTVTRTTTFSLTVTAAPSFDFGITNGGNKTVVQGQNVTNTVSTTLTSGSTAAVTFTASGLPTGVTAAFSPTSCSPACSTTLTLTAGASATVGTGTITVTGTSGSLTHTSTFSLTVSSSNFVRTININSLEARTGKVISGTLAAQNISRVLLKSYSFTTGSTGDASITFDIAAQSAYLKLTAVPFLTRVIAVDLNTATTYNFPQLLVGDINQDNIINSIDYSTLNGNWFGSNATSDFNQDGIVNSIDYSFMNKHWLVSGEQ